MPSKASQGEDHRGNAMARTGRRQWMASLEPMPHFEPEVK